MVSSGIDAFLDTKNGDVISNSVATNFIDGLKDRIEKIKEKDVVVKELVKAEKKKRRTKSADSDLTDFIK